MKHSLIVKRLASRMAVVAPVILPIMIPGRRDYAGLEAVHQGREGERDGEVEQMILIMLVRLKLMQIVIPCPLPLTWTKML